MNLASPKEAALLLLDKMVERDAAYVAANAAIAALGQDSTTHLSMLDDGIYEPLLALIDAALGEDVGSYFWNECRSSWSGFQGLIIERDGTEWPITSVADVRRYVERRA